MRLLGKAHYWLVICPQCARCTFFGFAIAVDLVNDGLEPRQGTLPA
jgi:hypothetical protein